jgi:acyl-CoA synthetase (AMP-forming)/AMP-acid ligase II
MKATLANTFDWATKRWADSVAVAAPTDSVTFVQLRELVRAAPPGPEPSGDGSDIASDSPSDSATHLTSTDIGAIVKFWAAVLRGESVIVGGAAVPFPAGRLQYLGSGRAGANEAVFIFRTAGTTGTPKFLLHSSQTLLAGLVATLGVQAAAMGTTPPAQAVIEDEISLRSALEDAHLGASFLSGMPLDTMAGYVVMQRALLTGSTLVLPRSLRPPDILEACVTHGVQSLSLPALTASRLAVRIGSSRTDPQVPNPAFVGIGGSRVDRSVASRLEETWDCTVSVGYGSTELGGVALMAPMSAPPEARWATVGTAVAGVTATVSIDPALTADGKRTIGTLFIDSPSAALGYVDSSGAITPLARPFDTGDLAECTADGSIVILGRADRVIIRGGRNIDPSPIEGALTNWPGVEEAVVFGVPSRSGVDQDVAAVVRLATGSQPVGRFEISEWVRGRVPGSPPIRYVMAMTTIPQAHDGNPDLGRLLTLVLDDAGS